MGILRSDLRVPVTPGQPATVTPPATRPTAVPQAQVARAPQTPAAPVQPPPASNGRFFSGNLLQKGLDILSLPTYALASFTKGIREKGEQLQRETPKGSSPIQQRGVSVIGEGLKAGLQNIIPGISKRTSFGTGADNYDIAGKAGLEGGAAEATNLAANLVDPTILFGPALLKLGGKATKLAKVGRAVEVAEKIPGAKKVAGLATKLLPAGAGQTTKVLTKAGEEITVKAPNKISGFQQMFNRVSNLIGSQGEAGKTLATGLKQARDYAETAAGHWTDAMPTVRNLTADEFDNFVDVAEGKAAPITARVTQAMQEWVPIRDHIINVAKQVGVVDAEKAKAAGVGVNQIPLFEDALGSTNQIANYFPHRFDPKYFTGDGYKKAVAHLIDTGQANSQQEAIQMLNFLRDQIRGNKFGNLDFARKVDLPGYQRTKEALFTYIEGAANRLAQAHVLGPNSEKAEDLINKIAQSGGDANAVKDLFQTAMGQKQYGQGAQSASRFIRGFQGVTKLGTGALTNIGQSVNTATTTGILRTLKQIPGAIADPEKRRFALRAGTTLDGVIRDLKEGSGFGSKVLGKLTAPGFSTVEKFNRVVAANAGRDFAVDMAQKAAKGNSGAVRALEKLGLNAESIIKNGGKLSEQEQIQAARNIVERTQFKVDPMDLPGWSSSPWGKVVAQFRTFSYNQTAFMKREILDELRQGNAAPAIRFLITGLPVGLGIKEAKNFISRRTPEEDSTKRLVTDPFKQVGGFGLAGDIYSGFLLDNSKYLPPERATVQALSALGGPTVGTVGDIATTALAVRNAVNPNLSPTSRETNATNLKRTLLRQVPLIGQPAANTLYPYKPKGTAKGVPLTPLARIK